MNTKRLTSNVSHSLIIPPIESKELLQSAQRVVEFAKIYYSEQMIFGDRHLLSGIDLRNSLLDYDRVKNNTEFFKNNL